MASVPGRHIPGVCGNPSYWPRPPRTKSGVDPIGRLLDVRMASDRPTSTGPSKSGPPREALATRLRRASRSPWSGVLPARRTSLTARCSCIEPYIANHRRASTGSPGQGSGPRQVILGNADINKPPGDRPMWQSSGPSRKSPSRAHRMRGREAGSRDEALGACLEQNRVVRLAR